MAIKPLGRKKISRKKPGEKTTKNYFDDETQEAIVEFQKELNIEARNQIYLERIMPAFTTLVENLINVYGFKVTFDSASDLKNECLEFLFGVLGKFNADKGSRAFSYFNVVAKHWLTIKSKQNAKNVQTYISIDNKESMSQRELELIENHNVIPSCDDVVTEDETRNNLKNIVQELLTRTKTENEQICVKAIELLVKHLDEIDIISKRATLLYLREITGLSSKQLSIVLSTLRKQYRDIRHIKNNQD